MPPLNKAPELTVLNIIGHCPLCHEQRLSLRKGGRIRSIRCDKCGFYVGDTILPKHQKTDRLLRIFSLIQIHLADIDRIKPRGGDK